jgi:hypothetical protein
VPLVVGRVALTYEREKKMLDELIKKLNQLKKDAETTWQLEDNFISAKWQEGRINGLESAIDIIKEIKDPKNEPTTKDTTTTTNKV